MKKILTTVALAAGTLVLSVPAASADDFTAIAVQGLSHGNLYVDDTTTLSNTNAVQDAYQGSNVGVVALPSVATQTLSASQMAATINAQDSGHDTIIVVVDNHAFGVSAPNAQAASTVAQDLNSAGSQDMGAALASQANAIKTATTVVHDTDSHAAASDSHGAVGGLIAGVFILAALAAGGAVAFKNIRRGVQESSGSDGRYLEVANLSYNKIPDIMRDQLEALRTNAKAYRSTDEIDLIATVNNILTNSQQLLERMEKKGNTQQVKMVAVEYTDTLTKLNKALSPDYYLDIIKNPGLWDNPNQRKLEVRKAATAVASQLVTNIQQVNASQDLDLKVALGSLVSRMEESVNPDTMTNGN